MLSNQSRAPEMQYCYPAGQPEKSSNIYETSVQGSNGGSLDRWNAPYYPTAPEQTRPDAVPSSLAPGTLNHYSSRSSISSSDSHLFSPKQGSGPPLYSPTTPPHVSVAYQVKTQMDNPNNPSSSTASQRVKSEAKHQTIEMAPSVPMQPGFISQLATYMADMVVYLWYSEPKQRKAPIFPKPTALFAGFCHDVLMTTQVSQSVVVLALLFIWKLQRKHAITPMPGSEFKITITALMLANKILDDHTYTNKTWSEVSGLPVQALNEAEMEFLEGLDFSLHVSQTTFAAWVDLLERPRHARSSRSNMRKKARMDPSVVIAPSAPTSPIHSVSNPGLGFDFTSYGLFVQTTLPSTHSQPVPEPVVEHCGYPIYAASPYLPPPSVLVGPKKRKLSSGSADYRRPSTSSGPPSYYPQSMPITSSSSMLSIPSASSGLSNTFSSISTSSGAMDFGLHPSYHGQPEQECQSEFSTLTSQQNPPDLLASRSQPTELAYYALAAGQQRGGYLAYQPAVQPQAAMENTHLGDSRTYAGLPRRTSAQTAVYQPQAEQVALSMPIACATQPPVARATFDYPASNAAHATQLLPPPSLPATNPYAHYTQSAASSPLQTLPSGGLPYPNSLPSFSPEAALSQTMGTAAQQQRQQQQVSQFLQPVTILPLPQASSWVLNNGYYSSFSNSGFPGVMHWPTQSVQISKYNTQPSHGQQPPSSFSSNLA